ncbi:hypothetical protein OROMI_020599 [Orobanche minor]
MYLKLGDISKEILKDHDPNFADSTVTTSKPSCLSVSTRDPRIPGDFKFLPFGSGRRMCPWMTFGLVTVELALAQLLFNFDWRLPLDVRAQNLDMLENSGVAASRRHHLFAVATPYRLLI